MTTCERDPRHVFPPHNATCPWCALIGIPLPPLGWGVVVGAPANAEDRSAPPGWGTLIGGSRGAARHVPFASEPRHVRAPVAVISALASVGSVGLVEGLLHSMRSDPLLRRRMDLIWIAGDGEAMSIDLAQKPAESARIVASQAQPHPIDLVRAVVSALSLLEERLRRYQTEMKEYFQPNILILGGHVATPVAWSEVAELLDEGSYRTRWVTSADMPVAMPEEFAGRINLLVLPESEWIDAFVAGHFSVWGLGDTASRSSGPAGWSPVDLPPVPPPGWRDVR